MSLAHDMHLTSPILRLALAAVMFVVAGLASSSAAAHGHGILNPFDPMHPHHHHAKAHRRGGTAAVLLGAGFCIPGRAACSRDAGPGVDGRTRPSFGGSAELGYRFNPYVAAAAHYTLAFLDPDYEVPGGYERVLVHGVYGVVRPTLPMGRFDLSLGVGPGFARQILVRGDSARDYSDGFSALLSPSIDVFVAPRVFLGATADIVLNAPRRTCQQTGSSVMCGEPVASDPIPIHTVVVGLRIGGTFL